jgi:hypothetical protein
MGGIGSGRRATRGERTLDQCSAIDVNYLSRHGCLRPGATVILEWTRASGWTSSVTARAESDRIHPSYRLQGAGEVNQFVPIEWTACRFGGARPYFVCVGADCDRRATKLYLSGRHFVCRHCAGLTYATRRETPTNRAIRRAAKIRRSLGGDANLLKPFPDRPKGMRWSTYWRLHAEGNAAEERAFSGVKADLERRLAKR